MYIIARVIEKIGSGGAIISAMGCIACFPALGSLGAAIGLGFLSSDEGLFINTLLPISAGIALLSNLINWFST
ncbi:MAG: mercuric ion transport protein [Oleiphilaceae bacterium]|jgi:mercuric ion transport protein